MSSKFKDLCKYEFIKSIVFDTDTFTKEDVNIENIDIDSMIEETAVNYLKELLTSENKELVARIRLTQTECDSQKKSAMRKLARKPVSRKSASKKSVSSKPVRKSASRKSVSRKSVSRKRKPAKK